MQQSPSGGNTAPTPARILVVDDEQDLREMLGAILAQVGHAVTLASSAEEAQVLIAKEVFDLVLTDIHMGVMSGFDLLIWITENHPKIRVVLMTGHSDVCDTLEATLRGARGFLNKPFRKETLLDVVMRAFMRVSWADFDASSFASTEISEFVSPPELKYALFIRLHDGRFMKVGSPGDSLPRDNLLSLRSKGITELWLSREDFAKYREDHLKIVKSVVTDTSLSPEDRMGWIKSAAALAYEEMCIMGVNEDRVKEAATLVEGMLNVFVKEPGAHLLEPFLEEMGDTLHSHAITCAALAAAYGKLAGWTQQKTIEALVLGAFFHDIGLSELPLDLQRKLPAKMSAKEVERYRGHPHRSAEILRLAPTLPSEVVVIAQQHHEHPNGTGFPSGLKRTEINHLSRIVSLIDCYVDGWQRMPPASRAEKNAASLCFERVIQSDPMAFESRDAQTLRVALSDMSLAKGRHKLDAFAKR